MRKLLRLLTVSVVVLGLIGVVLALVVPHLLDPNAYKDRLGALVKERTGHTLTIDGDIKLAVFPWLALELGQVQLSNAPGFGKTPLAQAQHASVRVKLLPLLHKQVQVDKISIEELQVHLARDAHGQVNWQGFITPAGVEKALPNTPGPVGPAIAMLEVGGIELRNARLEWDDETAGTRYQVGDINIHTGRFAPGEPFLVAIGAAVASGQGAPAYRIQLNSTVSADPAAQRYRLSKARLELGLPPGGTVTLSSDADLDLAKQTLVMPNIELGMYKLKLTGKLQGSRLLDNPEIRGELQLAEFSPRDLLKSLGKTLPASADPVVLSKASASFGLQAGRDHVAFKPLSLHLDETTVSGEVSLRDFAKARYGFQLEVDDINVDRYLPPLAEDKKGVSASAATATPAAPWPVETLRVLNLDGSLHIGRLQAYRLRSTDVRVTVKSQDGVLRVQPASARLYEGDYQGDVAIDARTATPRISLNESLRAVQIGDLLKDLQGAAARLSGKGELNARLQGAGADPEAVRRNLNGSVQFAFKDGAVRGFNLAAKIRKAKAALKGQTLTADSSPDQTDFSALTGTATITDGVARSDDLQGKSPYMRVSGAGQADLGARNMDYLLKVVLVRTGTGQGGAGLEDLSGISVPVRISGPFAQLSYRVDLNTAVGEAAKARLEEKKEELGQKIQDKLQNKLKGFFH